MPVLELADMCDSEDVTPKSRRRPGSSIAWDISAPGAPLLLALLVYRPWEATPFDIVDFSEFLPLLQRSQGFWDAVTTLGGYYAGHGRFIPVWYGYLAGSWLLFGGSPLGWQIGYGIIMAGLLVTLAVVLRRMLLGRLEIALALPLFCFSSAAVSTWLRFAGEPIGTLFLLVAIGAAVGYREAMMWPLRALVIAVAVLFMVFTKETFVVCVPLVIVFACCWTHEGTLRRPVCRTRLFVLCGILGVICLADAYVVHNVLTGIRADAYAAQYQVRRVSLERLSVMLKHLALPLDAPGGGPQVLAPPNIIFFVVLSLGLGYAVRRGAGRRIAPQVGLALLLMFLGSIVYLPWPRLEPFYELPYSLGMVWLLAWSVSELRWIPRVRAALVTAWVLGVVAMVLIAYSLARGVGARREVNYEVAMLAARLRVDSIFVATGYESTHSWWSVGQTLRRYATIWHADETVPPVRDVSCGDIEALLGQGRRDRVVLVNYVDWCGMVGRPIYRIHRRYSYFDWQAMGMRTRQLQVNFVPLP